MIGSASSRSSNSLHTKRLTAVDAAPALPVWLDCGGPAVAVASPEAPVVVAWSVPPNVTAGPKPEMPVDLLLHLVGGLVRILPQARLVDVATVHANKTVDDLHRAAPAIDARCSR